jgi:hypothetical protein
MVAFTTEGPASPAEMLWEARLHGRKSGGGVNG